MSKSYLVMLRYEDDHAPVRLFSDAEEAQKFAESFDGNLDHDTYAVLWTFVGKRQVHVCIVEFECDKPTSTKCIKEFGR